MPPAKASSTMAAARYTQPPVLALGEAMASEPMGLAGWLVAGETFDSGLTTACFAEGGTELDAVIATLLPTTVAGRTRAVAGGKFVRTGLLVGMTTAFRSTGGTFAGLGGTGGRTLVGSGLGGVTGAAAVFVATLVGGGTGRATFASGAGGLVLAGETGLGSTTRAASGRTVGVEVAFVGNGRSSSIFAKAFDASSTLRG